MIFCFFFIIGVVSMPAAMFIALTDISLTHTAWRIAMHRFWQVPWRTHNNMLPHHAGMIDPELWFAERCIKFISMCMKSDNNSQNYFYDGCEWIEFCFRC